MNEFELLVETIEWTLVSDSILLNENIEKKIISSDKSHPKYDLNQEIWTLSDPAWAGKDPTEILACYNKDGVFIGDLKTAKILCDKYGISPIKRNNDSNVCSIGYSDKDNKWYGWSHRAISSFDTRKEAEEFAQSVS